MKLLSAVSQSGCTFSFLCVTGVLHMETEILFICMVYQMKAYIKPSNWKKELRKSDNIPSSYSYLNAAKYLILLCYEVTLTKSPSVIIVLWELCQLKISEKAIFYFTNHFFIAVSVHLKIDTDLLHSTHTLRKNVCVTIFLHLQSWCLGRIATRMLCIF